MVPLEQVVEQFHTVWSSMASETKDEFVEESVADLAAKYPLRISGRMCDRDSFAAHFRAMLSPVDDEEATQEVAMGQRLPSWGLGWMVASVPVTFGQKKELTEKSWRYWKQPFSSSITML